MDRRIAMPAEQASDKEWLLKHAHDYAFWTGRKLLYQATGTDDAEDCDALADKALSDLASVVQRIQRRKGIPA